MSNRKPIVAQAVSLLNNNGIPTEVWDVAAFAAWHGMTGTQREQLMQLLFHGPIWDGDIISKAARDDLFAWGLAARCCFRGEQGHTAATYRAYTIWKSSGAEKLKPRAAAPIVLSDVRPSISTLEEILDGKP